MAEKENLSADALPKAVGPYQHAVEYGGIIYMSAQLPIDAETNELVPGDIRAQTRKVMENLCTLLEGCGSSLAKILACRVYITDMSLFSDVNAVGPLGGNDFVISIHAPRVGSDTCPPSGSGWRPYFNPRSPCGERQQIYTNKYLQICAFYTIFKCIY